MDVNRGRRAALAMGAVGAAGAGTAVFALPLDHGLRGVNELGYAVAFVAPVLGTLAALTGRARAVVVMLGLVDCGLALLFAPWGLGVWLMPAAGLLLWAGLLPAEPPAQPWRRPRI